MTRYTNDKIKNLIKQQEQLEIEIQKEIEKEKSKYKFSWKRFLFFILIMTVCVFGMWFNHNYIPKDSIWSWEYYSIKQILGWLVALYFIFGFGIMIRNSLKKK